MQAIRSRLCVECSKNFTNSLFSKILPSKSLPNVTSVRWRKRWAVPYLRELYNRRLECGPEPERHRSVWTNWNFDAEIYAFGQRLGEDFNAHSLRRAFTHQSYLDQEAESRTKLGVEQGDRSLALDNNEMLAEYGQEVASTCISSFLHHCHPRFADEGVRHVRDYLLSDETVSRVARHIGIADLMLCADFPPKDTTLTKSLFAVIGALLQDEGRARAEAFVGDFIIPQLVGKDINELWPITDPMGLLARILSSQGRPEPEPRLTRQTGGETVVGVFFVGIYCNKQLIGEAPGETIPIAEEMAARDALKELFNTKDDCVPLRLGSQKPDLGEDEHDEMKKSSTF